MSSERRLEKSVDLDAGPEQVWEAISTGPGMSLWFVPHELDEGTGEADFGGGNTQAGMVLAREDGRRIVYGAPDAEMALEFLVEGRERGGTVLRLVQSGFSEDNWEAEFDGFGKGWDMYFHNLSEYFRHFAGLSSETLITGLPVTAADAWARLGAALDLPADAAVGDRVVLRPAGLPELDGEIDLLGPGLLGLRTATALHRFQAMAAHGMVNTTHYYYGGGAVTGWQAWLENVFR